MVAKVAYCRLNRTLQIPTIWRRNVLWSRLKARSPSSRERNGGLVRSVSAHFPIVLTRRGIRFRFSPFLYPLYDLRERASVAFSRNSYPLSRAAVALTHLRDSTPWPANCHELAKRKRAGLRLPVILSLFARSHFLLALPAGKSRCPPLAAPSVLVAPV